MIKNFEELDLFKVSRQFVKEIYLSTSGNNFRKDYGLRDQLQRASVSIILNLAEGFDSGTTKSMITFLRYSYRSASEVRAIMYLALDLEYITSEEFEMHKGKILRIQKMLSSFINYIETRQSI